MFPKKLFLKNCCALSGIQYKQQPATNSWLLPRYNSVVNQHNSLLLLNLFFSFISHYRSLKKSVIIIVLYILLRFSSSYPCIIIFSILSTTSSTVHIPYHHLLYPFNILFYLFLWSSSLSFQHPLLLIPISSSSLSFQHHLLHILTSTFLS